MLLTFHFMPAFCALRTAIRTMRREWRIGGDSDEGHEHNSIQFISGNMAHKTHRRYTDVDRDNRVDSIQTGSSVQLPTYQINTPSDQCRLRRFRKKPQYTTNSAKELTYARPSRAFQSYILFVLHVLIISHCLQSHFIHCL